MEKIISFLFGVLLVLTIAYFIRLHTGLKPFENHIKLEVKGLYESCRISGGFTKVERDDLGRRVVICTIPIE